MIHHHVGFLLSKILSLHRAANYFVLGLDYTTICCDGTAHLDSFNLQDHLPGQLFTEPLKRKTLDTISETVDNEDEEEDGSGDDSTDYSNLKRKPAHRKALVERLLRWRRTEHENDPLRAVYPEYCIVTEANIGKISMVHPVNLTSPTDITRAVQEKVDGDFGRYWSPKIFEVIKQFDTQFTVRVNKKRSKLKRTKI